MRGQRGGAALARVLFGDADPGGRLPVTFPGREADTPTAGDPQKYPGVGESETYKEGVFVGYRWYDAHRLAPAFPFGFGLSYTAFRYRGLRISPARHGSGAPPSISVEVTNTGARPGVTVPELYLALPPPSPGVRQPPRQLKAFTKLALAAGQSRRVVLRLNDRSFSYWSVARHGWRVAPGCYGVMVGSSSRDLPLTGTLARGGARCARAGIGGRARRPRGRPRFTG